MARIPDADLESLKAEVSVERLVEAAGIALTKSNKDRLGKCPFHEGGEPSLVVRRPRTCALLRQVVAYYHETLKQSP